MLTKFSISFGDADPLALLGTADQNLEVIRRAFRSQVSARGRRVYVAGPNDEAPRLKELFARLIPLARASRNISPELVQLEIERLGSAQPGAGALDESVLPGTKTIARPEAPPRPATKEAGGLEIATPRLVVHPKTRGQVDYVRAIEESDVVIAIGPAGTGKTYLAVAKAVSALVTGKVTRIVLTRPAVEAGESLGFLPGGFKEKVDPYLRPLYDALYDMIPMERIRRLIDEQVIEVAPLAYMRGRTLSDSFVILDEAQNTTSAQMKMFLTRLGWNSKAIVTGDITQIDLDRKHSSGLVEVQYKLRGVKGIRFCYLDDRDVVRPPLVAEIIRAYEKRPDSDEPAGPS